jgi:hypothetical protein
VKNGRKVIDLISDGREFKTVGAAIWKPMEGSSRDGMRRRLE